MLDAKVPTAVVAFLAVGYGAYLLLGNSSAHSKLEVQERLDACLTLQQAAEVYTSASIVDVDAVNAFRESIEDLDLNDPLVIEISRCLSKIENNIG